MEKEMAVLLTAVGGLAWERDWCILGASCRETSHTLSALSWSVMKTSQKREWITVFSSPSAAWQVVAWGGDTNEPCPPSFQVAVISGPRSWLSVTLPAAGGHRGALCCSHSEPSGVDSVYFSWPDIFSFFWFVSAVFIQALLISTVAQNITLNLFLTCGLTLFF